MQDLLQRNFGHFHRSFSAELMEGPVARENLERYFTQFPTGRCLSSHRFNIDIPWQGDDWHVQGLTIVRDPTSRLLSQYLYTRDLPGNTIARKYTLDQYLDFVEETKDKYLLGANGQVNFLIRETSLSFDHLLSNIEEESIMAFTQERYDWGCILLKAMFPNYFRKINYVIRNVTRTKKPTLTESQKERLGNLMKLDRKFYQNVNEKMDQLISTHIGGPAEQKVAISKFKRQQQWRKIVIHPLNRLLKNASTAVNRA